MTFLTSPSIKSTSSSIVLGDRLSGALKVTELSNATNIAAISTLETSIFCLKEKKSYKVSRPLSEAPKFPRSIY